MTFRTLLVVVACAFAITCRRGQGETVKPAATPAVREAEGHKEADVNTVRVEEGMLRDLRITTDAVESRQGGEQISLLGELAVDQRAYAEVSTPVVARVTRLLVNAGDPVRRG